MFVRLYALPLSVCLSSCLPVFWYSILSREFAANPRQFAANPRQFAANPLQFAANPRRERYPLLHSDA